MKNTIESFTILPRFCKILHRNSITIYIFLGNPKLTLGLTWTIILHFQIEQIVVKDEDSDLAGKKALLKWAQENVDGYGNPMKDFTKS
jgi:hypothetical protein